MRYIGIDISKDTLDVAVLDGPVWQVPNTEEGIAALTTRLQTLPVLLVARGKPHKVALVACMRKMLVILHVMAKTGTPWQPTVPDTV